MPGNTMNQTYLISLNAPPMGEGDARYAAVTVTPEVLGVVRRCRQALKALADLPGFGHVTRRHSVPAIVFGTLPECLERVADAIHDGPVAIGAGLLPALEALAIRTEMEGLEVGPDWLAFIGYEKHGYYEFTGSLPDFAAIQ